MAPSVAHIRGKNLKSVALIQKRKIKKFGTIKHKQFNVI